MPAPLGLKLYLYHVKEATVIHWKNTMQMQKAHLNYF